MSRTAAWVLFGPPALCLVAAAGGLLAAWIDEAAWASKEVERGELVGSSDCLRCHPDQHRSWKRSFHRTMTQRPEGDAVLAPFEGETLAVAGFVATMDRDSAGAPRITVMTENQPVEQMLQASVDLTIGSHRIQQYAATIDRGGGARERWRLPVAWHVAERRWIHLGGAFLFQDPRPGNWDDWTRHLSRWNDNCIFCHNTAPNPGLGDDGVYQTEVGELGIGCEACHGLAGAHVRRQADPAHRVLVGTLQDSAAHAITQPLGLEPGRADEVCGRCHGNRIGHDLASILAFGDRWTPGQPLEAWSRPIFADATLASTPAGERPFAPRFWPDGTPRLSAYEYQALLLSPCYDEGRGLGCSDCHTMHGAEPSMQLREDYDSTQTCVGCHAEDVLSGGAAHGGHRGISCADCHLPRVTYGLLSGMMSHRVTSPDPAGRLGRTDMPDACTQCHVDRSRLWACSSMEALGFDAAKCGQGRPAFAEPSQVELDLVGGDPIQRALAAHALGRPPAVGDSRRRAAALVDGLEDDYAAVRWVSARALEGLAAAQGGAAAPSRVGYDFMDDASVRIGAVDRLRAAFGVSAVGGDPERMEKLVRQREATAIEIGE